MNECITILAHVEEKHVHDVISHGLHHAHTYLAATQKGVADLCLCQLATCNVHANACMCIRFSHDVAIDTYN